LVSNYHVVKDATKVRLLTGVGLIDAKVVQVDAANDLALLKADGKFSPLPIAASRTAHLGGTVATVGFPDIGLQGFAPGKVISDVWWVARFLSSHLRRWRWHERGVAGGPCGRPPIELRALTPSLSHRMGEGVRQDG
jgi:Trypsin-like peptidase domain